MLIKKCPIAYFDERPSGEIKALVFHCSTHPAAEMVEVLQQKCLSSHYIIGDDGGIIQCVAEDKRAWHAGVSRWRDMENLNHYSIGIELSSASMGQESYPDLQIESLIELSQHLIKKYNIPAQNVVAHSDVAPCRKPDPGIMFPWQYLAQHNIGLWYDAAAAKDETETDAAKLLAAIGYDVTDMAAAGYAFCRHFLPQRVAKVDDIQQLIENVFPADFRFSKEDLPILQAVKQIYR